MSVGGFPPSCISAMLGGIVALIIIIYFSLYPKYNENMKRKNETTKLVQIAHQKKDRA